MLDSLTGGRKISDMTNISSLSDLNDLSKVFIPVMDGSESVSKDKSKSLTLSALKSAIETELASFIEISCLEFTDLYNNGGLIPGISYCLKDFISYMYIPGSIYSLNDERITLTNVAILGSDYLDIHPILTATTAYQYGNGYLKEYPWIEVDWSPIDSTYYESRMPGEAFPYGVITRMKDTRRNIETEFDYLNAVVRSPGFGNIQHAPERAGTDLITNGTAMGFFRYQQLGDAQPQYSHRFIYNMRGTSEALNTFFDQFLVKDIGTRRVDTLVPEIYTKNGSSVPLLIVKHYIYSQEASLGAITNNNSYFYGYFLYRTWLNSIDDKGIGNSISDEVRNIYIGRSPITSRESAPWRSSNVPLVVVTSPYKAEFRPTSEERMGSLYEGTRSVKQGYRNISIRDSDMIYIGRKSILDEGIVDSVVNIDACFGINLLEHYGRCMFDHVYFSDFTYASDINISRSAYLSIAKICNSKIDNGWDLRLNTILDSKISRAESMIQLYNTSIIVNSKFENIYCESTINDNKEDTSGIYGNAGSILDNVYDSEFSFVGGINNNNNFIPTDGVLEMRKCSISYVKQITLCIGKSYTATPVFDRSYFITLDNIMSAPDPTNNFIMSTFPWVVQGLKFSSDGVNGVVLTATSPTSKPKEEDPYVFLPNKNLDILYNSTTREILRYYGGWKYNSECSIYCSNL